MEALAILFAAATGLMTYALEERAKRKAAATENKRVLYEGLIRTLVSLLAIESGDKRSELLSQAELSWLFASDEVLTAVYDYLDTCDELYTRIESGKCGTANPLISVLRSSEEDRKRIENELGRIFIGMRTSLGAEVTEATKEAQRRMRLYNWGIIESGTGRRKLLDEESPKGSR